MFVIEKTTGQVKLVVDGVVTATVLDLAVNSASERGLLGIALHPRFPRAAVRLPLLDVPHRGTARGSVQARTRETCDDAALARRRHQRHPAGAAARQPRRSLRVGRQGADLRSQPDLVAVVPGRRRAGAAGPERRGAEPRRQSRRRRHPLRPRRQALRRHRRQRDAAAGCRTSPRGRRRRATTTSSAAPSRTTRI